MHVALAQVQAGKLRMLAAGGAQRSPVTPEVPSLADEGVTDIDVDIWYAMLAPAGLAKEQAALLNAEMNAILADPEVRDSLLKQGLNPHAGQARGPHANDRHRPRALDEDRPRRANQGRLNSMTTKLDIFNHIFPRKFYERMLKVAPNGKDIHKRVRAIPAIVDLDARFRIMDQFGDYAQIICLGSPPIEVFGPPPVSTDMARLANDGMAELVRKHPDRFPAFIASLPMNDPEGLLREAKRAVRDLGAVGVQVFTNVLGKPLTAPETRPLFELMAKLDLPDLAPSRTRRGVPRLSR